jgi:hypothetical protein
MLCYLRFFALNLLSTPPLGDNNQQDIAGDKRGCFPSWSLRGLGSMYLSHGVVGVCDLFVGMCS